MPLLELLGFLPRAASHPPEKTRRFRFSSLATRTSVQSFSISSMVRIMTTLCQSGGDSKCLPNLRGNTPWHQGGTGQSPACWLVSDGVGGGPRPVLDSQSPGLHKHLGSCAGVRHATHPSPGIAETLPRPQTDFDWASCTPPTPQKPSQTSVTLLQRCCCHQVRRPVSRPPAFPGRCIRESGPRVAPPPDCREEVSRPAQSEV